MSKTVHGLAAVTPLATSRATERTRVRIPLRFGDGYSVTAEAVKASVRSRTCQKSPSWRICE